MDQNKFDEYVKNRYKDQVRWYDRKSVLNKRLNHTFQISIIILAAIVPIFAALQYTNVTIVFSAIVAAGIGILKYCKFEEKWHNYRTTCETLRKEKIFYDNKVNGYENADNPEKLFVERVEALISKENTKWLTIMTEESSKRKR